MAQDGARGGSDGPRGGVPGRDVDASVGHELSLTYTPRLDDAVALALTDFRRVTRKESRVPYISHLFAVTALVAEGGGDEDQLIAAMLHDWLEDIPGSSGEELHRRFGGRVQRIVEALTDTIEHPKPPWRARKERFIEHIREQPAEVKLVCSADKLHNGQTLVRDLLRDGPATLDRFRGGRDGTAWYYAAVAEAIGDGFDHWLHDELVGVAAQIRSFV
ncbi:MAG: HD domain-containing protein [Myxococcota bacterium]